MNRSPSCRGPIRIWARLIGFAAVGFALDTASLAAEPGNFGRSPNPINGGAQIECITPDGRILPVSAAAQNAPATIKDDAITCPLREGETVFIIAFPKVGMLDRLTFVNENVAACGELTISVSNSRLPANSPTWTEVDGSIPFAHKRLFNLSMLGVEARYVKLSFRVQASVSAVTPAIFRGPTFAVADR